MGMRRQGGFTLVEVLAAVAILGSALFVLLDAHYTAMQLHSEMQMAADYRQMLETTVNRAEVAVMQGELSGGGDFGMRHPEFTWGYDAVLVGTETIQLYEVTARVTGHADEQIRTFLVYAVKTPEESQGVGMFQKNQGQQGQQGQGGATTPQVGRTGGGGMFDR